MKNNREKVHFKIERYRSIEEMDEFKDNRKMIREIVNTCKFVYIYSNDAFKEPALKVYNICISMLRLMNDIDHIWMLIHRRIGFFLIEDDVNKLYKLYKEYNKILKVMEPIAVYRANTLTREEIIWNHVIDKIDRISSHNLSLKTSLWTLRTHYESNKLESNICAYNDDSYECSLWKMYTYNTNNDHFGVSYWFLYGILDELLVECQMYLRYMESFREKSYENPEIEKISKLNDELQGIRDYYVIDIDDMIRISEINKEIHEIIDKFVDGDIAAAGHYPSEERIDGESKFNRKKDIYGQCNIDTEHIVVSTIIQFLSINNYESTIREIIC